MTMKKILLLVLSIIAFVPTYAQYGGYTSGQYASAKVSVMNVTAYNATNRKVKSIELEITVSEIHGNKTIKESVYLKWNKNHIGYQPIPVTIEKTDPEMLKGLTGVSAAKVQMEVDYKYKVYVSILDCWYYFNANGLPI